MRIVNPTRVGGQVGHLAPRLVALFPRLGEQDQRLAVTVYRLLGEGGPVSVARLAEAVGRPATEVRDAMAEWPGVMRDGTDIVAFRGLSLAPTRHTLKLPNRTVYTWCAWDTLFLPALLGETAVVESRSPDNESPISLVVSPEGIEDLHPAGTLLSMILPKADMMADLITRFCGHVFFFPTESAGRAWQQSHDNVILLTAAEGYLLGHHVNRGRFPAVLATRP